MICYKCGAQIGNATRCPVCGQDLETIQHARKISNSLYNDGYTQACVRDLSGAINTLQNSLKYNKYNIEARNLLGLIYYEIGETVNALSEWVISMNFQPEHNRAAKYLKELKENSDLMEQMNQITRKYNQAVHLCEEGSMDMAMIQLKKVVSMNPKMVKAHQLLALLYIQNDQLDKARKTLKAASKVDAANTITFRYQKEVNRRLHSQSGIPEPEEDLYTYQSGNEIIIMPKRFRENNMGSKILYMIAGLFIGIVASIFLIAPQAVERTRNQMQEKVVASSDALATTNQKVSSLERQISDMQKVIDRQAELSNSAEQEISSYENLLLAYMAYKQGDLGNAAGTLGSVDRNLLSESTVVIYNQLKSEVGDSFFSTLYEKGVVYYNQEYYTGVIESLSQVVEGNRDYQDGYALYYLAMALDKMEREAEAGPLFEYLAQHYPSTERGRAAQKFLDEHPGGYGGTYYEDGSQE